ncbi:hypothetical protein GCM10027280_41530 [Micromonospora polyrhachis]
MIPELDPPDRAEGGQTRDVTVQVRAGCSPVPGAREHRFGRLARSDSAGKDFSVPHGSYDDSRRIREWTICMARIIELRYP